MEIELTPTDPRRRRRIVQSTAGLALGGAAAALIVKSGLGLDPWNVFHQGLAEALPLTFGMALVVVGVVALMVLRALGEQVSSVAWIGLVITGASADLVLAVVPEPGVRDIEIRCALLVAGVLALGFGTALGLGSGRSLAARDGMQRSLAARTPLTEPQARTALEGSLATIGFALGGVVNFGTAFAVLAVGPIVRLCLPFVTLPAPPEVEAITETLHRSGTPAVPAVEHHLAAVRLPRASVRQATATRR